MKKIISLLICAILLAVLGGCGGRTEPQPEAKGEPKKLKIVTTIYPLYDWTREILGGEAANAELTLLARSGADMHSYQPTAEDLVKLSSCDVLIYVGGESDQWMEDARKEAVNKNMVALRLMDVLGDRLKQEAVVEGMEANERQDHDKDGHDHAAEYDEHIWLSLKNAGPCVDAIADALARADAGHAQAYRANAAAYGEKLSRLGKEYETVIAAAPQKTLLFGDRFPFRYMVDDYGLQYYAAFPGCSAETEASFETIAFLSAKLDELKLPAILVIEGGSRRVAETILYNTPAHDQKLLVLDSMQSTQEGTSAVGSGYLDIMRKNLGVLKEALR